MMKILKNLPFVRLGSVVADVDVDVDVDWLHSRLEARYK
jgi:hypothetical protein